MASRRAGCVGMSRDRRLTSRAAWRRLGFEQLEQRQLLAGSEQLLAPFAMVLMPDTQYYSQSQNAAFPAQTQWIADHLATENLAFVSHVGDVVQTASVASQWQWADTAMDTLDGDRVGNPDGLVPYSLATGNHDYSPSISGSVTSHTDTAGFRANFGDSRYAGRTWYGGGSADDLNHYQVFSAGGREFLHISLEFEPRDAAISWAQGVLDAHPDLPVILSTHSYLTTSGRSTEQRTTDGRSGEDVFQEFVRPNPQIFMVLCGHNSGEYHQVSTDDAGLEVIEILAD
jgi:hypothetical protein